MLLHAYDIRVDELCVLMARKEINAYEFKFGLYLSTNK